MTERSRRSEGHTLTWSKLWCERAYDCVLLRWESLLQINVLDGQLCRTFCEQPNRAAIAAAIRTEVLKLAHKEHLDGPTARTLAALLVRACARLCGCVNWLLPLVA
jgi:hypothetical protein